METKFPFDPYISHFKVLPGCWKTGEAAGRDATGLLNISLVRGLSMFFLEGRLWIDLLLLDDHV